MAQHHIDEVTNRVASEVGAGKTGALFHGDHQRVNELETAADGIALHTPTRRTPRLLWVENA